MDIYIGGAGSVAKHALPDETDAPLVLMDLISVWTANNSDPPDWVATEDPSLSRGLAKQLGIHTKTFGKAEEAYAAATTESQPEPQAQT